MARERAAKLNAAEAARSAGRVGRLASSPDRALQHPTGALAIRRAQGLNDLFGDKQSRGSLLVCATIAALSSAPPLDEKRQLPDTAGDCRNEAKQ